MIYKSGDTEKLDSECLRCSASGGVCFTSFIIILAGVDGVNFSSLNAGSTIVSPH